jgi:O-6-methylguanine DNA methyltransferase
MLVFEKRVSRLISVYSKRIDDIWFEVACDDECERVFGTNFGSNEKKVLQELLGSLPKDIQFQQSAKISAFAEHVFDVLKKMYDGQEVSVDFDLAMDYVSEYTKRVMKVTCAIPLGYVASYGAVAKVAGGSARAVGRVMATHPFPPILPCHRVVAYDFTLGGYGGGLASKAAFLRRESRGFDSEKEIVVAGKKLVVFPAEFALKKVGKA